MKPCTKCPLGQEVGGAWSSEFSLYSCWESFIPCEQAWLACWMMRATRLSVSRHRIDLSTVTVLSSESFQSFSYLHFPLAMTLLTSPFFLEHLPSSASWTPLSYSSCHNSLSAASEFSISLARTRFMEVRPVQVHKTQCSEGPLLGV